jgi:hypothetical protein
VQKACADLLVLHSHHLQLLRASEWGSERVSQVYVKLPSNFVFKSETSCLTHEQNGNVDEGANATTKNTKSFERIDYECLFVRHLAVRRVLALERL